MDDFKENRLCIKISEIYVLKLFLRSDTNSERKGVRTLKNGYGDKVHLWYRPVSSIKKSDA